MSDYDEKIQHLEGLCDTVYRRGRDKRQSLAEHATVSDPDALVKLVIEISACDGEYALYTKFLNRLRRGTGVSTAKRDVLSTIMIHGTNSTDPVRVAFLSGRLEAYGRIDATFRDA